MVRPKPRDNTSVAEQVRQRTVQPDNRILHHKNSSIINNPRFIIKFRDSLFKIKMNSIILINVLISFFACRGVAVLAVQAARGAAAGGGGAPDPDPCPPLGDRRPHHRRLAVRCGALKGRSRGVLGRSLFAFFPALDC